MSPMTRTPGAGPSATTTVDADGPGLPPAGVLTGWYRDLHHWPELSGHEQRTAAVLADRLGTWGWQVHRQVGGEGVVALLDAGPGPTVVLRAELDGLPVREQTDLPFRSVREQRLGEHTVAVSHACGHDVHLVAACGAAAALATSRSQWSGRVAVVLQPAEETGSGARAMLADGLRDLVGPADHLLALHTSALPTGQVTFRPGQMTSAGLDVSLTFLGEGGHAAWTTAAPTPVQRAAEWVHRVSGGLGDEGSTLTVGSMSGGSCANVVADRAELRLSIRADTAAACQDLLREVRRSVHGAAQPAGGRSEVAIRAAYEPAVNDDGTSGPVYQALRAARVPTYLLPAPSRACDDVGTLADGLGAGLAYWFVGANDAALFSAADLDRVRAGDQPRGVPGNHSPRFAPDPAVLPEAARQLLLAARGCLAAPG